MKKYFFSILALVSIATLLQSCANQKFTTQRTAAEPEEILLGKQTIDAFKKAPYSDWYLSEYQSYAADDLAISELKNSEFKSLDITIFLGSWCGDSHREFPRLVKILEKADYPLEKLHIIALGRDKRSPENEEHGLDITRVPTILVSRQNKEIGRIVEAPESGWIERDFLKIIHQTK